MQTRIRFAALAVVLVSVMALAALTNTQTARAQACVVTNVTNNTACALNLCMYDAGGAIRCWNIPVGGPTGIALGGFLPVGVISAAGVQRPFGLGGCTVCTALRGPGGICCGQVCYSPAACTITITACGPCVP